MGRITMTGDYQSVDEAANLARALVDTNEAGRVELFHQLRQSLRLSRAVRGLNRLLEHPVYRPLGAQALKCLGMERGG